eukprot:scaffold135528_cov50-Prasinocladus_malaysianus.AAC.1
MSILTTRSTANARLHEYEYYIIPISCIVHEDYPVHIACLLSVPSSYGTYSSTHHVEIWAVGQGVPAQRVREQTIAAGANLTNAY